MEYISVIKTSLHRGALREERRPKVTSLHGDIEHAMSIVYFLQTKGSDLAIKKRPSQVMQMLQDLVGKKFRCPLL
jgi:hypothetical protein